jgi:Secreted repeat of unknown function
MSLATRCGRRLDGREGGVVGKDGGDLDQEACRLGLRAGRRSRTNAVHVRSGQAQAVTCVRVCAAVWPPVKLAAGAKAVARGRVKATLLGSDKNPTGGRVVTYAGWPLYTYVSDTRPGVATGQALNLNGGLRYVLAPSGKVIRTKVH